MQSQIESERSITRTNMISTDRPDTSQLVDLHVYIIPKNVWKDRQNLAENEAMEQAISAGFVRVPQNLTIHDLRLYILNICGQDDQFPREFVYLRSVGRCLAKVKPLQETDLRVKNYRPPMTFAPEIYVLEGHHDDDLLPSNSQSYIHRETPVRHSLTSPPRLTISRQQSWVKTIAAPSPTPLTTYPPSLHSSGRENSTNFNGRAVASFANLSASSSTLSARDLAKLREEQERLRLRQIELARQRREIEQEQQRRTNELVEKQKNLPKDRRKKEEAAATTIQAAYRGFRHRRKMKKEQQQKRQHAANEIERLQKEARELTRRKAKEEHEEKIQAHGVSKLSNRIDELKAKRTELEATRETIVRRMQQSHAKISVRRKEERNLWKQKYVIERKKTTALEERIQMIAKDQPLDLDTRVEQTKLRLDNGTKLRQQAENEAQLLKQELQLIRSSMNALQKNSLPKQPPPSPQEGQPTLPISLDITLQY